MYLRYAESRDLSDDELKVQIIGTIRDITETWPENFEYDPQALPTAETETLTFIQNMADLPPLKSVRPMLLQKEQMACLRIIYRLVTIIRWTSEIELRTLAVISLMNTSQFLGIRYVAAAEMIEGILGENLKYDYDRLADYLLIPYNREYKEGDEFLEMFAEEEINRVLSDDRTANLYADAITKFEDNLEAHIRKALPTVFVEFAFRLTTEAIMASAHLIDDAIGSNDELDIKYFGEVIDQIMRGGRRFTNERLGIKRGGKRSTSKFVWTDDRKREFYKITSSLVHQNGQPLWKFAYEELVEKDFSYHIVGWLRTETELKGVPNSLWNDAMKAWKGAESGLGRLQAAKTPEAYAMYHAVHLLGYPETAYSTLKKYFGQGKKLSLNDSDI